MPVDRLREHDPSGQLDDVLALPDHVRDALWRAESTRLPEAEASGLVVCGMGGSAIGGDLALAALGDRASRPVDTVRGYELPGWTESSRAVLCSSYSGNTEETLACFEAAEAIGTRRYVATSGGRLAELAREAGLPVIPLPGVLQPRAAVAYMLVAALEVAAATGAAPRIHTELDSAAAHLEEARDELCDLADRLAEEIGDAVPVVYGCDLTAPVAYRWKTQVNENAKRPAFWHQLPELDHNEIVGWEGSREGGFAAVFLEDDDQHPRERRRAELTAELIASRAGSVRRISTRGGNRAERLLWGVMLGDLLSLHLAARNGVDPAPVEVIERLKDRLGRP